MKENPEYCKKMIEMGCYITMERYNKLKEGEWLTYKGINWDTGKIDDRTVWITSLYKDEDGNGCWRANIYDEYRDKCVGFVTGCIAPYIPDEDINNQLKASPEEEAAYQCTRDLSNGLRKRTPDWDDVKKAFLMGIEYQKKANQ